MDDSLTIPAAATRLTIGESTLRRYLRRRLLDHIVLPGNDVRIELREIEEFKKARTVSKKDVLTDLRCSIVQRLWGSRGSGIQFP